jgi:hypothetical protein
MIFTFNHQFDGILDGRIADRIAPVIFVAGGEEFAQWDESMLTAPCTCPPPHD